MLGLYREVYRGWNVKHFYEHLRRDHGFRWGYTWVKTQLHTAGLVERAKRRGAHRRKRERKPCEGMMLHQDGSRAAWLGGEPALDLIATMDDATSTIYSAFLVEEEGTASTFQGLLEVFTAHGLPSSLYTDRGSHYFYTAKAGEAVDRDPGGPCARSARHRTHCCLFAGSAGPLGADVRDPAGPPDQGACQGWHHGDRGRERLDPERLPAGSQCTLCAAGGGGPKRVREGCGYRTARFFVCQPVLSAFGT
jgi:hypothetical protein